MVAASALDSSTCPSSLDARSVGSESGGLEPGSLESQWWNWVARQKIDPRLPIHGLRDSFGTWAYETYGLMSTAFATGAGWRREERGGSGAVGAHREAHHAIAEISVSRRLPGRAAEDTINASAPTRLETGAATAGARCAH